MKNVNSIFFLSLFFLLLSCKKKIDKVETLKNDSTKYFKSNYFNEKQLIQLKYDVLFKGDEYSYGMLILYYSYNPLRKQELFPFSLKMANKYKNKNAFYEVYKEFIEIESDTIFKSESLIKLENFKKKYAIGYLEKGCQENSLSCIKELEKIYRKGLYMEKNIIKADSLYNVIKKN